MEKKISNYQLIDVLKYFFAICVIAIHIHPLEGVSNKYILNLFDSISLLAVPFFLCCTGYFVAKKFTNNKKENLLIIKKYIKKNLKYYVIFTIIYLPFTVYDYIINSENILHNILDFIRGFFLIGEHYNSWILWYLLGIIYSLIILYVLCKLNKNKFIIFICGVIFYIVGCMMDFIIGFNLIPQLNFIKSILTLTFTSGRLFKCLIYISFGVYISTNKKSIIKYEQFLLMALLFINVLFNGFIDYLLIPLTALLLFDYVINLNIDINFNTKILRYLSQNMYFWHLFIWGTICLVFYKEFKYGLYWFLFICLIINLISIIHLHLTNKIGGKK